MHALSAESNSEDIARRLASFEDRTDIATLLKPRGIGIELGVAEGGFSEQILKKSSLDYLYSVDMWAGDRGHDVGQYKIAIRRLASYRTRNAILKLRFDEALDLFPDNYFDFIYVDGYAHNGEEEGRTYDEWYPKLKTGGLFAGHDYSPDWPLVVKAVDDFVRRNNLAMHIIDKTERDGWGGVQYPSWLIIKP